MTRPFPEIAELAELIADRVCPASPVDPEAIAREEGISWRYGNYGHGFDGLLAHRKGKFRVFCNAERGSKRGRFTFGHELGHYFIDEHRLAIATQGIRHLSVGEWHSDAVVERQADTFAANLLMPTARFHEFTRSLLPGLAAVVAAANKFAVSVTSAAFRFVQTTPSCCAMVMWNPDGHCSWSWGSDTAYLMGLRRAIRQLPVPSDDFATASALAGVKPPAQGFFEKATTASTWFPSAGSRGDAIMMEQAMRLGDYGTLTMLVPSKF